MGEIPCNFVQEFYNELGGKWTLVIVYSKSKYSMVLKL